MKCSIFFISSCLIAVIQIDAFIFSRSFFVSQKSQRLHMCVDRQVNPELLELAKDSGPRSDSDNLWRTEQSTIIPVDFPKFTGKPSVITFDAFDTLIEPSQSIGRWYREALNSVGDMRLRLPRPAMFTAAFEKAYADMYVLVFFIASFLFLVKASSCRQVEATSMLWCENWHVF
jgi:hypothetical protein